MIACLVTFGTMFSPTLTRFWVYIVASREPSLARILLRWAGGPASRSAGRARKSSAPAFADSPSAPTSGNASAASRMPMTMLTTSAAPSCDAIGSDPREVRATSPAYVRAPGEPRCQCPFCPNDPIGLPRNGSIGLCRPSRPVPTLNRQERHPPQPAFHRVTRGPHAESRRTLERRLDGPFVLQDLRP